MTADFSYSLEALERRWQLDKTPQVGLRLAEEYRRSDDFDAAIETLAAGLEVYPTHTSTRVALSRYLVDAGRFLEAVPHLEQIVSLDPAHLVANKLLVGAYAGIGRIEEARDKLAIYEMMGEGDADIERLRDLIEAASREAAPGQGDSGADQAVAAETGTASAPETAEPAEPARPSEPSEPSEPARPSSELPADDSKADPEAALAPAVDSPAPDSDLASGVRGEASEERIETTAAAVEEGSGSPFGPPAEIPVPDSGSARRAPSAESEEPFGMALQDVSPSGYWQGIAGEDIFTLESAPAPVASTDAENGGRAEVLEDVEEIFPAASPVVAAPPEGGPDARVATASTVTLGRLYLEQGHREKAIEVFKEVLEREPANQEARRELGLLEAAGRREPGPISSPAERKREALSAYRARLRRAVAAGI